MRQNPDVNAEVGGVGWNGWAEGAGAGVPAAEGSAVACDMIYGCASLCVLCRC